MIRKKFSIVIIIFLLTGLQFLYGQDKSMTGGSCSFVTHCEGNNAVECSQSWLQKSKCFTEEYIQSHFKNFRISEETSERSFVAFDFMINGYNLCKEGFPDCQVAISKDNNGFIVDTVSGPLKMYEMNVSKEKAIEVFKNDKDCIKFSQVNLRAWDQFNKQRGDGFIGYEYDPHGLHWEILTDDMGGMCGRLCMVNVKGGKLYKGKYSCM